MKEKPIIPFTPDVSLQEGHYFLLPTGFPVSLPQYVTSFIPKQEQEVMEEGETKIWHNLVENLT